ncbi:Carboxypeptidase regulatory-like domain-containing protein [Sinosporangium album]|uniref:Carboxypeptidase regulatory-like domain-containing protein n=1 Tax=Sinosporangium album TaxID=504805 RepID=A0A1G7TM67_9ACTN|nr:S8 family serine peptidase [Sinosporangium album]SDG35590.1 Carboxypeptidase regulatory-like domain-containing protein [Sinosporangium album]
MIPRHFRTALIGAVAALTLLTPHSVAMAAPTPDKIDKTVLADLKADDKATFWVHLRGSANLSATSTAKTKADKAEAVYRAKTAFASSSQAELVKLLKAVGADYTPFWITNSVHVTGNAELATSVARLPQVTSIVPARTVDLPKPAPVKDQPKTQSKSRAKAEAKTRANGVEWNVDRINAPRVWNEIGTRGEGVVVANIDSGVQFDHPALARQYRGKKADGTVDHNYNWFDPSRQCSTAAPCDNDHSGTHTMGTMVGDDGGTNQIGVAPGAKWIAAKACQSNRCSEAALLAAGQWILAPTDLNGANPRPDLAPDVVNNSWTIGYYSGYKEIIQAWVAAGIFPVFANGDATYPVCGTTGTPGRYVESYSVGAFDQRNGATVFSSRGAGDNGEIKPNITAPGFARSSIKHGGYRDRASTGIAAPHVAATVALIWSASPSLLGDVAATRAVLDRTAIDMSDTSCGGTAGKNNVWGEGRLDAYAAVQAAPSDSLGTLNGTVTSGGTAVADASVAVAGPQSRTVTTGQDGKYSLPRLLPGDYRITVKKFGHTDATATATVDAEEATTANVALTEASPGSVSGTVTHTGAPEAGAEVTAVGTSAKAVTDAAGRYRLALPRGAYDLKVTPASRCATSRTAPVTVNGDLTKDFDLANRSDAFGYVCAAGEEPYIAGTDRLGLSGDLAQTEVYLPFTVPLYGSQYTSSWISTDGNLYFRGTWGIDERNVWVHPFNDDLIVDGQAGIYTAELGTAPKRTFVVEWRNVTFKNDNSLRVSVSAAFGEDGSIRFFYKDLDNPREFGDKASVGLQDLKDTIDFWYSQNSPALKNGQSLTFTPSRRGPALP